MTSHARARIAGALLAGAAVVGCGPSGRDAASTADQPSTTTTAPTTTAAPTTSTTEAPVPVDVTTIDQCSLLTQEEADSLVHVALSPLDRARMPDGTPALGCDAFTSGNETRSVQFVLLPGPLMDPPPSVPDDCTSRALPQLGDGGVLVLCTFDSSGPEPHLVYAVMANVGANSLQLTVQRVASDGPEDELIDAMVAEIGRIADRLG